VTFVVPHQLHFRAGLRPTAPGTGKLLLET
jgi:hypothetical protein